MSSKETYNLFFSHYHEHEDSIQKLKSLLQKQRCIIRDSSIDSSEPNNATNEEYIKSLIRPKIDWASTLVVLIGPETHSSEWVNWEIEYANAQGKRIVGVYLHGSKESDVPDAFEDYGDALIGWNSGKVFDAISGKNNDWEDHTGSIRAPRWTGSRLNC